MNQEKNIKSAIHLNSSEFRHENGILYSSSRYTTPTPLKEDVKLSLVTKSEVSDLFVIPSVNASTSNISDTTLPKESDLSSRTSSSDTITSTNIDKGKELLSEAKVNERPAMTQE